MINKKTVYIYMYFHSLDYTEFHMPRLKTWQIEKYFFIYCFICIVNMYAIILTIKGVLYDNQKKLFTR